MVVTDQRSFIVSCHHCLTPAECLLSRFLLLIIVPILVGCTRTEYPNSPYPVSGRVQTRDGTPASDVRVTLHSSKIIAEGDPFRPSGMTGDDGTFQLTTYETHDGAPAGSYAMTFRWAKPQKTLMDPISKDRLRNKFARPTEKSLTCDIIGGESQDLGIFEIDTKKLTIERVNP